MDFELSDEQVAVQRTAEEFAKKEIQPYVAEDDKNHTFRKSIVENKG